MDDEMPISTINLPKIAVMKKRSAQEQSTLHIQNK